MESYLVNSINVQLMLVWVCTLRISIPESHRIKIDPFTLFKFEFNFLPFLGVPFNIASYALLTYMIAHVTGLKTGDFVHTFGDTHIYKNHISAMEEQIKRTPRDFPTLNIKRKVENIEDFKWDDFEIMGYDPHPKLVMDMAV